MVATKLVAQLLIHWLAQEHDPLPILHAAMRQGPKQHISSAATRCQHKIYSVPCRSDRMAGLLVNAFC